MAREEVTGDLAPGRLSRDQWRGRTPSGRPAPASSGSGCRITLVPSALVTLDRLPLTPSGKIDRRALPTPDKHRPALDEGFRGAPDGHRSPAGEDLGPASRGRAGGASTTASSSSGGHSLLAMQLLSRIHAATRVDVPLAKFFETPTVAHMAEWIDAARPTGRGRAPIPPVPRGRRLSASVAQEHLWLLEQAEPRPPSPNISHVLASHGAPGRRRPPTAASMR
jgi:hypothetical protein